MTPRLTIDIGKIRSNAHKLVQFLAEGGIEVTAVTKSSLGCVEIANALLQAGVRGLGDSRIENIQAMKRAGVPAPMTLIRSPMMSQVERVVHFADVSFNTELSIIKRLSDAARSGDCMHGVVLMVELGDLREGILPEDVEGVMQQVLQLPNIELTGIGANLACRSGVVPDATNMAELSTLATKLEANLGISLCTVSGGNSANLEWLMSGAAPGRINNLRLGESIILGREPLERKCILGLHTNAIALVAEVIESKLKPSLPKGTLAQTAFGKQPAINDRGTIAQSILAVGRQDIDPSGLYAPPGIEILGASSDHLIVASNSCLEIGSEVVFAVNYSALLQAMTSSFVHKVTIDSSDWQQPQSRAAAA